MDGTSLARDSDPTPGPGACPLRAPAPEMPAHDVRQLTRGGREACLLLDGTPYRLRITRADKLILTK